MQTAADLVRLLERHCTAPFFPGDSYADVVRTAQWFPAALSNYLMFERPLDQPDFPVDYLFWVPRNGRRDILAGTTASTMERLAAHDAWRRIGEFSRAWLDPASPLHEVGSLWLEVDIRKKPDGIPVPLVFFTVEPHISPAPGLAILQQQPLDSPALAAFHRCWDAIPGSTRYRTVGILYSRPTDSIRLILIMPPDTAVGYLDRIGWPGPSAQLRARLGNFLRFHSEVALHLEVSPSGVGPDVGMEIYTDANALYFGRSSDWTPVLDTLVAESLCTTEMRDALLAWVGSETIELPGTGNQLRIDRNVHHIKIVSRPDLSIRAKAYTTAAFDQLA